MPDRSRQLPDAISESNADPLGWCCVASGSLTFAVSNEVEQPWAARRISACRSVTLRPHDHRGMARRSRAFRQAHIKKVNGNVVFDTEQDYLPTGHPRR